MSNFSLFQITREQEAINFMLEESGGELTPEIEAALAINEANLTKKAESYCTSVAKYAAMEDAIKAEIKRLQAYAKTCGNIQDRLKERLREAQLTFGFDKLECGTWRIGTRKSTRVIIDNEVAVPDCYVKITTCLDKAAIGAALKAGGDVPGAHIEEFTNISIR